MQQTDFLEFQTWMAERLQPGFRERSRWLQAGSYTLDIPPGIRVRINGPQGRIVDTYKLDAPQRLRLSLEAGMHTVASWNDCLSPSPVLAPQQPVFADSPTD